MGDDLDRKIDPRDSTALQEISRAASAISRVVKPSNLDVLCGRGAPIQSHEGNVRMRKIVSNYARRYMEARKYRKQLIAEDALLAVKNSSNDKSKPVRFLKKTEGEEYWEEVDDKIACDKVQHTLRNFVRKLEGEGEASIASEGSSSAGGKRRGSLDSLSQSRFLPANETLDRSSLGIDALRRPNPVHLGHAMPNLQSLPTSGILPPLPPQYGAASAGSSQMAAEADLQYRLSLRRMSTEDLIRLVAAERAERAQRQALVLENPTMTASISPVPQFGQQDFQRMPPSATSLTVPQRGAVLAAGGARDASSSAGEDETDSRPSTSNRKDN